MTLGLVLRLYVVKMEHNVLIFNGVNCDHYALVVDIAGYEAESVFWFPAARRRRVYGVPSRRTSWGLPSRCSFSWLRCGESVWHEILNLFARACSAVTVLIGCRRGHLLWQSSKVSQTEWAWGSVVPCRLDGLSTLLFYCHIAPPGLFQRVDNRNITDFIRETHFYNQL